MSPERYTYNASNMGHLQLFYLNYKLYSQTASIFPGGPDSKESACSAGHADSIPGSGRSPGEGNGYSLQYSCLGNALDRGAWQATNPWGHEESDMTEQLTLFLTTVFDSQGCHYKVLQTGQLKTTEMCSLTVLEIRSLELQCQQGYMPDKALEGNPGLIQVLVATGIPWLMAS